MRLIDGDKLAEILDQWRKDCLQDDDQLGADIIGDVLLELYDAPTLTPPTEWVSVEERLDGVLQALRAGKSLGKEKPQRCDRGLERHDFGEKEGANQWMRSNAPC